MSENRWSIWFDVEGFSTLYSNPKTEVQAIRALGELMEALYRIGTTIFSQSPERLFIHQFGDGFVVVSDFPEKCPDRPIAVSLAVMRHLALRGVMTKVAISGGGFADIGSCYPSMVMEASEDGRHVKLGEGLMTIIPVMGTALIAAHKLANQKRGGVLLFNPLIFASVPGGVTIKPGSPAVIDWVHSNFAIVEEICIKAGLAKVDADTVEKRLKRYIDLHRVTLSEEWIKSTLDSVGLTAATP